MQPLPNPACELVLQPPHPRSAYGLHNSPLHVTRANLPPSPSSQLGLRPRRPPLPPAGVPPARSACNPSPTRPEASPSSTPQPPIVCVLHRSEVRIRKGGGKRKWHCFPDVVGRRGYQSPGLGGFQPGSIHPVNHDSVGVLST